MFSMKYKDLLPVGNGLIIAGVFFFLGLLCGNFPYDFKTLYTQGATEEAFLNSLKHYQTWYETPTVALHILHAFIGLGFIGMAIKIYKPSEDAKYFEYGSLFLYVIAVCIYLTNLKTGAESAVIGDWGEVDWMTGVNVIAASEAMIMFLLGGIIALQVGLYYAEVDYKNRLEQFNKEEEDERLANEASKAAVPAEPIKKATKVGTDSASPKAAPSSLKKKSVKPTTKKA